MRIENEVLLDYSDVLIRPKRSTLGSRKADCVSIVYGVFGDYFMSKCLILLEAGTGIEPVYTDLQSAA